MRRVVDIVESGGILLSAPCATFEEAVRALVDSMITSGCLAVHLRDDAVRAVFEREALASTAMVDIGVSIPHARLAGVGGVIGALAASPTAIYYAMTGVPISIVALVFSAPDLAGDHLNVLAGLSMLLQSESVRRGLEQAGDPAAALAVLRAQSGYA